MSGAEAKDSPLAVLAERDFALYWFAQAISFTGTWMQQVALSWVILDLDPTAFALGLANFASGLPPALLLLAGGVVADRFERRRIILASQVVFMLAAFAMAALARGDGLALWPLYALLALVGATMAFDLPATQAFVAELVPREKLGLAISLNQSLFHGTRLVGPALAGWCVARYGSFAAFLANGLSFLPVILTLLLLRPRARPPAAPGASSLAALREGLAYVRGRPDLKALLGVTAAVIAFAFPQVVVQMAFYVRQVLGLGPDALGVLMAVGAGAALLGSLLLVGIRPEARVARLKAGLLALVLGLPAMAAAPRASVALAGVLPRLVLPGLAVFVLGVAIASTLGLVSIIVQQSVPDAVRGRVSSLQALVFLGILPFSALAVTSLSDLLTMPAQLLVAAALLAVVSVPLARRLEAHAHPTAAER